MDLSPPRSPSPEDADFDSSKPFLGVVICCTSIPPDQRTDIAAKAVELGGVHKYDLTPDCTHLIVGEYNTPKYRHVARDRPDIKPMAAGWIEAVRNLWVNDAEIDFDALEAEWQLKTFETGGGSAVDNGNEHARGKLLCCMTGFDDPESRHQITNQIVQNGGIYMGDLTKRVTHLVVYKAEGRKYQAAKSWGIHTVSIEWVNDSVARGMILDEKCYDPILPPKERGEGAWNKKEVAPRVPRRAAKSKSTAAIEEGKRKLRKTASMKLNTQRDNLWGDILGKPATAEAPSVAAAKTQIQPSASALARNETSQASESKSMYSQATRMSSFGMPADGMVFASCGFYIHGFSGQKTAVVVSAVSSLGGLVCHTLDEVVAASGAQLAHRFLVVPQSSPADTHPQLPENVHIVTEFYIEKCMHKKYFFNPAQHVFGRPFPVFPITGFEGLTICAAGFTGVDLNHLDKALKQLGARYEERFTADASVLICDSLPNVRPEKLEVAVKWKVPVVKAEWLYECISSGYNIPIKGYLFPDLKQQGSYRPERLGIFLDDDKGKRKEKSGRELVDKDLVRKTSSKARSRLDMDSSGFATSPKQKPKPLDRARSTTDNHPQLDSSRTTTTLDFETAPTHQLQHTSSSAKSSSQSGSSASAPLSETTLSALNRTSSPHKPPSSRKPLARITSEVADSDEDDAPSSAIQHDLTPQPNAEPSPPREPTPQPEKRNPEDPEMIRARLEAEKAARAAAERQALSTKLATSLLDASVPAPVVKAETNNPDSARMPRKRKRQVLGRAVSNVSAASSGSGGGDSAPSAPTPSASTAVRGNGGDAPPGATQIGYEEDVATKKAKREMMKKFMGSSAGSDSKREERLRFGDVPGIEEMQAAPRGERRSRRK
ncbi:hypothetical protein OQA88_5268 [Cercophora sp. LCS_1]